MAGINNLGKNLNVQKTQQLKATAKVDTQNNKNKEVGDAKPAAVWLDFKKANEGDVVLAVDNGRVVAWRCVSDNESGTGFQKIKIEDINSNDFERDRGDIRVPWS